MNHANEQVFLLGVGKELNIPLAAVVANHCKTRCLVLLAVIRVHGHEAPVHLVCLAGGSEIPASTVPLRGNSVARSRHKMLVRGDITLNGGLAAGIAVFFQPA